MIFQNWIVRPKIRQMATIVMLLSLTGTRLHWLGHLSGQPGVGNDHRPQSRIDFSAQDLTLQPLTGKHGHGETLKMETLENKLRD